MQKARENPDPSAYVRGLPSSTWALTSCQAHFLADGRWTQRMPELQLKGTECSEYLLITGERRKGQGQGGGGGVNLLRCTATCCSQASQP